jgi:hypothetical protein
MVYHLACLSFLICEMGLGQGWKPVTVGALDKGSEEREVKVRARSSWGQGVRRLDLYACHHSQLIHQTQLSIVTNSFPVELGTGGGEL